MECKIYSGLSVPGALETGLKVRSSLPQGGMTERFRKERGAHRRMGLKEDENGKGALERRKRGRKRRGGHKKKSHDKNN